MKRKTILLVEDDGGNAAIIRRRLESRGEFEVHGVATGDAALKALASTVPDALLLDTTLPDMPAQEICRVIRSRSRTRFLPCIMLGDRTTGLRIVDGLSFGADDYVTKPVDLEELEARLRAVLRRHVPQPFDRFAPAFRGRHIDANFADVVVSVDGRPVSLTRREFLLLRALIDQRNRTLTRTQLSNAWGSDARDGRVVDSAMWKLRRKLRSAGGQIETIVGFGYRFNEPEAPQRGTS
jgi:two-component system, OmpR family, response regulator RegX3